MSVPTSTKQWNVQGQDGFDSLKYSESTQIPKLGDSDVLVKIHGVSLNYRDLTIPRGEYPFNVSPNVVPCSDGAGTVIAIGANVTRFKEGDKVITLFNQAHIGGSVNPEILATGTGGAVDGTLRQYGAFNEMGLVHMPECLSFTEAATLTCAGLTAWNALFGLSDKRLGPGDWVLTQGTGGVSIFALQFAKAAGAKVISTTSSESKGEMLKKLGADHVLNYKTNPNWGAEAKSLTPGKLGVDHIVEVAGPRSMQQSLEAIKIDGVISIIGFVGGTTAEEEPGFLNCLLKICTVRGILVGSRVQMEEMLRAVENNPERLKPVVDQKVFGLEEAKEAYEYMWDGKHFGKVCIKVE